MSLSLNTPLSLYSIPLAWAIAFYPANATFRLIQSTIPTGYNNLQPRSNTKRIAADANVPREVANRIQRLEGAHMNGNEVLPIWIAAVLAGNMAGIGNKTLNIISTGFIATRILYNYVYINQKTVGASWFRTALFFTSLGFPMYLLVKAGNIMRKAAAL